MWNGNDEFRQVLIVQLMSVSEWFDNANAWISHMGAILSWTSFTFRHVGNFSTACAVDSIIKIGQCGFYAWPRGKVINRRIWLMNVRRATFK